MKGNHQEMTKLLASLLGISETEVKGKRYPNTHMEIIEALRLHWLLSDYFFYVGFT